MEKGAYLSFFCAGYFFYRLFRHSWQAVALLPFIDEKRLLDALAPVSCGFADTLIVAYAPCAAKQHAHP